MKSKTIFHKITCPKHQIRSSQKYNCKLTKCKCSWWLECKEQGYSRQWMFEFLENIKISLKNKSQTQVKIFQSQIQKKHYEPHIFLTFSNCVSIILVFNLLLLSYVQSEYLHQLSLHDVYDVALGSMINQEIHQLLQRNFNNELKNESVNGCSESKLLSKNVCGN